MVELSYPVYAVAEPTPRFAAQVRNLVLSLHHCGGSVQVGLVDGQGAATDWSRVAAAGLALQVTPVERVCARFPHANKIAGLGRIVADRPDWGVLADCDILFRTAPQAPRDTAPQRVDAPVVLRADPANRNRIPLAVWQRLGQQLREPALEHLAAAGSLPYVNSGMLHVSAAVQADLHREWGRAVTDLDTALTGTARPPWQFFGDQIALTLAIRRLGIEVAPLPPGENIPTHLPTEPVADGAAGSLHYHDAHTPDGFVLPPYSEWLHAPVERANARLAEHLGRSVPSLAVAGARYRWRRRGRALKHALQRQ